MDLLKNYLNVTDNNECLMSILIYDKNYLEVINYFDNQLEKAKKINDYIKKNKINNRLYSLINFIKDNYNENMMINSIFLIGEKLFEYKFNNNEILISREYDFNKLYYKCDNIFHINYFIDLYNNFNFIYSIKIDKNDIYIYKLNKNKEKIIENYKSSNIDKILECINNIRKYYKNYIIIYGNSQLFDKIISNNIIIKKENLSRNIIYDLYENEEMKLNHIKLEKRLNDIKNSNTNLDLYIFGKLKFEFKDAIESYSIKELFIEDKKLIKLKEIIDNDLLNFTIIPIRIINDNDIASSFIKDYNGIMGIKYF